LNLPIGTEHFDKWLILFNETINENFSGDKAKEVKDRALAIAGVFQFKMGLSNH
jgi:hemoglobin